MRPSLWWAREKQPWSHLHTENGVSGLQNELDSVRRLLLAANCLIPFGDEFFQPVEDVIGLENGTVALLRKRADSHQMWRGLRGRQVGHYLGFRASDWSLVRQILGSRHSLRVAVSLFDPQVDSAMDVAAVLGPVNCSSRSSGGGIGRQTSQISATGNDSAHSTHRWWCDHVPRLIIKPINIGCCHRRTVNSSGRYRVNSKGRAGSINRSWMAVRRLRPSSRNHRLLPYEAQTCLERELKIDYRTNR